MKMVYLSGGLHSRWQSNVIAELGDKFKFSDPSNHGLKSPNLYAVWDLHAVKKCDILFVYIEQSNPSGIGAAFEAGVAKSAGIPIILVDEKSASDEVFGKRFAIVSELADVVFNNLSDGLSFLNSMR